MPKKQVVRFTVSEHIESLENEIRCLKEHNQAMMAFIDENFPQNHIRKYEDLVHEIRELSMSSKQGLSSDLYKLFSTEQDNIRRKMKVVPKTI